ncbi:MAG: arsenate reductase [Nitrospirae bacterium GWC2_42_7]|nr:MAG: arsenate reductase [Nitrospirae bacterium GWC2_42_7]
MEKQKVLFVCVHNSARSQMAEAFLNLLAGDRFEAESAGLEPGSLNPLAVEVMKEIGIDISQNKVKGVFDFIKSGKLFSYVITVCDETARDSCPVFPGYAKRLHWSFQDPSGLEGTYEERLEKTRQIRDEIKTRIEEWLKETS